MTSGIRQRSPLWLGIWTLIVLMVAFCSQVRADDTKYITYATDEGTLYLDDNRQPALYTGDFGDCQGDSLINVTRFDASLYRDNLTVMFHMQGSSALHNERIMMYFSVFAYGENRFNLTFNPCHINIPTLCPLNSSVPVEANGLIPIGPNDLAGIPSIAFSIPDFEGQAILRLFANSTRSQIACYSAVMRNGNTFSHPAVIGSILGLFTFIALVSSVAVVVYGQIVSATRTHYAHSISIFVVFSILQHIFFTGSLSMNWPSVLVAFWSNYAWSAGMIYSRKMQNSINQFIGSNKGNLSMVGAAPNNQNFENLGGFQLNQIFGRDTEPTSLNSFKSRTEHSFQRRSLVNSSTGFNWYGNPVAPGLPLPGNYSGFAGTLGQLNIPASNAFMTGLLWLLTLTALVMAGAVMTKLVVEVLTRLKLVENTRLDFFGSHWVRFTSAAVLRTCFIAFFMMTYLTLFQLVLGGSKGAIALAAVVFVIFLVGIFGVAIYAIWYQVHTHKPHTSPATPQEEPDKRGSAGWFGISGRKIKSVNEIVKPIRTAHIANEEGTLHVHDNPIYMTKFGWLSARFRRSKWWFFVVWLVYEFGRACFYGAAAGHPLVQVFGLLAWEIISFVAIVVTRPFESNRLNLLMVYFLGFSKVATVALSCAFDPRFGLSRILTTVIGIIIIIIQAVLTICLMVAILLGAISSYMSITRHQEDFEPEVWRGLRTRYFNHIKQKATDRPPTPPPPAPELEKSKEPYFSVASVRREPKIEDEDPNKDIFDEIYEVEESPERGGFDRTSIHYHKRSVSRVNSVRSRTSTSNLPYGARPHRSSWSTRDFSNQSMEQLPPELHPRMSIETIQGAPVRYRAASLRDSSYSYGASTEQIDGLAQKHRRTRSTSYTLGKPGTVNKVSANQSNEVQPMRSTRE